ncbi:four helix bundle protein [Terriglobus sp. ADX1]|uniref:four helix bundle protein n=1 Tax=Terriglobus sp. ADX1 TaxID=2794063 RepID=UPI002FE5DE35
MSNAASQQVSESASQRGRTRNYRDLIAWQKAMQLAKQVNLTTERFPAEERFGLTVQMRRCAVSVPSNIAEGHGRLSDRALRMFLGNARGSLFELETQILLAADLTYFKKEDADKLLSLTAEVARILNGLLRTLEVDEA